MERRWWGWGCVFLCAAGLLWYWRDALLRAVLAAQQYPAASAAGLLALYALKGVTAAVPLSALEAAGGMLFPLPGALALNTAGVALAQTGPYWLGRLRRIDPDRLAARYPRLSPFLHPGPRPGRTVFLLRLGGASPGELVSAALGAVGISWRDYLLPGLIGSLPRVAAATLLGSALPAGDGSRAGASVAAGAALSALSIFLWRQWRPR